MRYVRYAFIILFAIMTFYSCDTTDSSSGYILTTNVTPEESGSISPDGGEFEEGREIELRATPADNYRFQRWQGDANGDSLTTTLFFNSDKEVTAVFVERDYPLNIEVEGEGGVREEVVEEAARAEYQHGTTVRLTAEPAEGWTFEGWQGDATGENPEVTLTIEQETNVTAVFSAQEYSVDISVEGPGQVSKDPDEDVHPHGQELTLTAEPDDNYRFLEWQGDAEGFDNPLTIDSVEEDQEIRAVFVPIVYPMWSMGYNNNGQLGDGTINDQLEPAQGGHGFFDVENVTAGAWHTLFVKTDGTLWGMGYNKLGQLGDGTVVDRHTPVEISSGVAMAAAGEHHSLFIREDGSLWGMGENSYGQLAEEDTAAVYLDPIEIDTDVKGVTAGDWHTLYVKNDGTLWAVGRNNQGQLGDGSTEDKNQAVQIDSDVEQVAAGGVHSLYVKTDGTLWAVGNNLDGQLGDGTNTERLTPVQIDTDVQRVAAGRHHTLYIKTDETLWATGNNEKGQLGNGSNTRINQPEQIDTGVSMIAAGLRHSVYVKNDTSLWTMGENSRGQLGDGTGEDSNVPIQIDSDVIDIAAGVRHTLFIKD